MGSETLLATRKSSAPAPGGSEEVSQSELRGSGADVTDSDTNSSIILERGWWRNVSQGPVNLLMDDGIDV